MLRSTESAVGFGCSTRPLCEKRRQRETKSHQTADAQHFTPRLRPPPAAHTHVAPQLPQMHSPPSRLVRVTVPRSGTISPPVQRASTPLRERARGSAAGGLGRPGRAPPDRLVDDVLEELLAQMDAAGVELGAIASANLSLINAIPPKSAAPTNALV